MGAVMTNRLARFHVDPQAVWVVPALAGLLITAYLSWGAWVSAHDLRWLTLNHAWWRADLAPNNDVTLLVALAVWLVAWAVWWWPRRMQSRVIGLITVAAMVLVGAVLGIAALGPCRGGETPVSVAAGVLGLYVGNPPNAYGGGGAPRPGEAPPGPPPGHSIFPGAA